MSTSTATKTPLDLAAESANIPALQRELANIPARKDIARENMDVASIAQLSAREDIIPRIIRRRSIQDLQAEVAKYNAEAEERDAFAEEHGRESAGLEEEMNDAIYQARYKFSRHIASVIDAVNRAELMRSYARSAVEKIKTLKAAE